MGTYSWQFNAIRSLFLLLLRNVIAQQLYGFAANGTRQLYTLGKFGIIADVTGDAFPEDVFCIPIRGTNGQELLFACFFQVVAVRDWLKVPCLYQT